MTRARPTPPNVFPTHHRRRFLVAPARPTRGVRLASARPVFVVTFWIAAAAIGAVVAAVAVDLVTLAIAVWLVVLGVA